MSFCVGGVVDCVVGSPCVLLLDGWGEGDGNSDPLVVTDAVASAG